MTQTATHTDPDALLDQLTLEEQVALLAGADAWRTAAVPRLNIPPLKVSDGPAGVRGGGPLIGGRRTAAYPVGIALGATWNPDLLREVGLSLAREARDKGATVLLAPTINAFRSSLNGRNFENYAEDPVLTGRLAAAYVQGLQAGGVGATPKHFAGNESEFQRGTIDSVIDERTLRELYLRPFEIVVKEARPWAIMTAYNRLNGPYCSQHPWLLQKVLRREWGFTGLVMSDWGGTHSAAEGVLAGLDLEMPGPAVARQPLLAQAQADPEVRAGVRERARAVLHLLSRAGTLTEPLDVADDHERDTEYPETRALIRRAGAEGLVLLKNSGGALPLPAGARVAVIGPNAEAAQVMGGGSAQMNAHRRVSPAEGLREGGRVSVVGSAEGTGNERYLPVPQVETRIEYRDQAGGPVIGQDTRPQAEVMFFGLPDGVNPDAFHATLTMTVDAPQDGEYEVSLGSAGLSRLSVDGQPAVNNWEDWQVGELYFSFGSGERRAPVHLSAGRHTLMVEYTPHVMDIGITPFGAVRVGFRARPDGDRLARAVALAAQADWVVLCVGTTGEWETEGVDRAGLTLPGDQDALIEAVLDVNPNVVVVFQTGGPVEMPWLSRVPAVMQAWFAGQEVGHAVADVLTGLAEPGGRLPQTFPHSLADDPTHPLTPDVQYPGEDGRVEYREGLYTGYRHVDRSGVAPMFPFGFGLSFTTFTLGEAQLNAPDFLDGPATVTVPVTNSGTRLGSTVAQLYVQPPQSRVDRPLKELRAFAKVHLNPGETGDAVLTVTPRDLAYFDVAAQAWVADPGNYVLHVGQSSADLSTQVTLSLAQEWREALPDTD